MVVVSAISSRHAPDAVGAQAPHALTMFGIAWGIVSITLMVAAGEGLRVGQARWPTAFGKDIMIVFAGRTSLQAGGRARAGALSGRDRSRDDRARAALDCAYVLPELGQGSIPCAAPYNSASLTDDGSLPPFAGDPQHHRRRRPLFRLGATRPGYVASRSSAAMRGSSSSAAGQRWARRSQVGDFPYTVIGVMAAQGAGLELRRPRRQQGFIPFSAMLRDFPNKPPAPPQSVDRLLVAPRSLDQHETARRRCARALGADPRLRSAGQGGGGDLGHGRGGAGIRDDDRRHEVLSGRGRASRRCFSAASA